MLAKDSVEAQSIDGALQQWRQGDLALEERWFVHIGDPVRPLTEAAGQSEGTDLQALRSEVGGLAVVTQTCDIVRSCCERPYIEVAPLVQMDGDTLHHIRRGRQPRFASLPALVGLQMAVDLDRVMTVEKSVSAQWERTPGWTSEADSREFARALSRKRERFAFPDDFTRLASKLKNRLRDKHERDTEEGLALRALDEIRVQAAPDWDAATVSLFFWFIRNENQVELLKKSWADLRDAWLKLVPASGRFTKIDGQLVALEDMKATDYVHSDRLDLDHLSTPT